jgi:hypothetical protein
MMKGKSKEYALVIIDRKDGTTKIEKLEMRVDRTRRPMRPELRKQIEAKYPNQVPKRKRK